MPFGGAHRPLAQPLLEEEEEEKKDEEIGVGDLALALRNASSSSAGGGHASVQVAQAPPVGGPAKAPLRGDTELIEVGMDMEEEPDPVSDMPVKKRRRRMTAGRKVLVNL